MLTSSTDPRQLAQCYQLGANSCVQKPVRYEEFWEHHPDAGPLLAEPQSGSALRRRTGQLSRASSATFDARSSVFGTLRIGIRLSSSASEVLVPARFVSLLLSTLLATVSSTAPLQAQAPQPAAQTRLEIPYQRFVLPNGLTLIVHEDHKAPIVAVNVWYHVGSKNEKPGRTGFAHLFEHLMFNGTENYDKDFFGPLEQAGATDMNGTTNEDRTNYFQNVPTNALDLALVDGIGPHGAPHRRHQPAEAR